MRFDIKPRYYDPVKEQVEQRTERIKRQLQSDGLIHSEEEMDEAFHSNYGSSIRGAFTQGSPIRGRSGSVLNNTGLMRLAIIVLLLGALLGFVYYGTWVLYALLYVFVGIGLLVLFFRLRRNSGR
jgi:Flp pilus assembly protein TadB